MNSVTMSHQTWFSCVPIILQLIIYFTLAQCTISLKIQEVNVPEYVEPDLNDTVTLHCRYEISDVSGIAVRWFRAGQEFFRFTGTKAPTSWRLIGAERIVSKHCDFTDCVVLLKGVTEEASGRYKCEVSREVPPYEFVEETRVMIVKPSGSERVNILGLQSTYGPGEFVDVRCVPTSSGTTLQWFINQEEIATRSSITRGNKGNMTSRLRVPADRMQFRGSRRIMTLQCVETTGGRIVASRAVATRWRGYEAYDGADIAPDIAKSRSYRASCISFVLFSITVGSMLIETLRTKNYFSQ